MKKLLLSLFVLVSNSFAVDLQQLGETKFKCHFFKKGVESIINIEDIFDYEYKRVDDEKKIFKKHYHSLELNSNIKTLEDGNKILTFQPGKRGIFIINPEESTVEDIVTIAQFKITVKESGLAQKDMSIITAQGCTYISEIPSDTIDVCMDLFNNDLLIEKVVVKNTFDFQEMLDGKRKLVTFGLTTNGGLKADNFYISCKVKNQ